MKKIPRSRKPYFMAIKKWQWARTEFNGHEKWRCFLDNKHCDLYFLLHDFGALIMLFMLKNLKEICSDRIAGMLLKAWKKKKCSLSCKLRPWKQGLGESFKSLAFEIVWLPLKLYIKMLHTVDTLFLLWCLSGITTIARPCLQLLQIVMWTARGNYH